MKRVGLIVACMVWLATPARAQFCSPEAWGGAAFGALLGGVIGGDCHGLSGTGAAIGAGVGFLAGAAVSASNAKYCSEAFYAEPIPVAQPGVGYVYTPAPVVYCAPPPPARPKAEKAAKKGKPSKPAVVVSAHQIPDAPRVPDAPTF